MMYPIALKDSKIPISFSCSKVLPRYSRKAGRCEKVGNGSVLVPLALRGLGF